MLASEHKNGLCGGGEAGGYCAVSLGDALTLLLEGTEKKTKVFLKA